jgi:pyruvate ferredoxin oxidoreductase beta subunit
MTHTPREKRPVTDYLKIQGRFSHMLKPGEEAMVEAWQKDVDDRYERLQKLITMSNS